MGPMAASPAEISPERAVRITAREESCIIATSEVGMKSLGERKQGLQLGAPAEDRGEFKGFIKEDERHNGA